MPSSHATFQIECETPMPLSEACGLLTAMQHTYDGLTVFDAHAQDVIEMSRQWRRYGPFPVPFYPMPWPAQQGATSDAVEVDDILLLKRVELSSPGFWEFLGALNPLEVIRRYLSDRHERKMDLLREPNRRRREELENISLEQRIERQALDNLRERLDIEREFGTPRAQLTVMYRQNVIAPLRTLGDAVDRLNATPGPLQELGDN